MSEHVGTVQNAKKGTERGQRLASNSPENSVRRTLSKTHQDYWTSRIKKRSYHCKLSGEREIPEWQVRIKHEGQEAWFNLQTPKKVTAANKARDIYVNLIANGWEDTLRKFKKKKGSPTGVVTVGDFLAEVSKTAEVQPTTLRDYHSRFRSIVAWVAGIEMVAKRFDAHGGGGREKWIAKVDAVKLHHITPEKVQKWKMNYLAERSDDPVRAKKARVSVNSIIRSGKTLFNEKFLRFNTLELPECLPFDGIEFEKVRGNHRYRSQINAGELIRDAFEELREEQPEQFQIFLLAIGAGLRRREIDCLTWKQLDYERNVLLVETNEYGIVKTASSEEEVDVDPIVMGILREYEKEAVSPLVVASHLPARPDCGFRYYRCERHFKGLIAWLRAKGIEANSPIHTLRKEFGSLICAEAGIFAASAQLRHSSIAITRDHYLVKKSKTTVQVGKLLEETNPPDDSDDDKIIPISQFRTA